MIRFPGLSLLVAGFLASCSYNYVDRKDEAYSFALRQISAICDTWSSHTLLVDAAPELTKTVTAKDADRLLRFFKHSLGSLVSVGDLHGQEQVFVPSHGDGVTSYAQYQTKAIFSRGEGIITVCATQREHLWKLSCFRIDSKQFIPDVR